MVQEAFYNINIAAQIAHLRTPGPIAVQFYSYIVIIMCSGIHLLMIPTAR